MGLLLPSALARYHSKERGYRFLQYYVAQRDNVVLSFFEFWAGRILVLACAVLLYTATLAMLLTCAGAVRE